MFAWFSKCYVVCKGLNFLNSTKSILQLQEVALRKSSTLVLELLPDSKVSLVGLVPLTYRSSWALLPHPHLSLLLNVKLVNYFYVISARLQMFDVRSCFIAVLPECFFNFSHVCLMLRNK